MKEIEGTESRKLVGKAEVGLEQGILNCVSWAAQLPGREWKEKQSRQAETLHLCFNHSSIAFIRFMYPDEKEISLL